MTDVDAAAGSRFADRRRPFLPLLFVLAAMTARDAVGGARAAPKGDNAVIVMGATLIDGTGAKPVPASFVAIHGGRFTDVSTMARRRGRTMLSRNVQVVDGTGLWIVPGFIDAHVHRESEADERAMARWGVTAARLMAERVAEARSLASASRSRTNSPDFFPAAPIFTVPGGWWSSEPTDPDLNRMPETPAEARAAVARAASLGSREIKIMDDDMSWCRDPLAPLRKIDASILEALSAEARQRGLSVIVHAPRLADARAAVSAGATALAHGILDQRIPDDFLATLNAKKIFVIPTLDVFAFLADARAFVGGALGDDRIRASLPSETVRRYRSNEYFETYRQRYPNSSFVREHLPIARENVRRLFDGGVPVALGTDMWAFPGAGVSLEMSELVAAGLTPIEAIRSATAISADSIGELSDRGTIESGKRADFVLLSSDPTSDVRNTRAIEAVWKDGKLAWGGQRR